MNSSLTAPPPPPPSRKAKKNMGPHERGGGGGKSHQGHPGEAKTYNPNTSNLYRPSTSARASLKGAAKIELQDILTNHSSHEVAMDILPEDGAFKDSKGLPSAHERTSSLHKISSFHKMHKSKIENASANSAHLFKSQRNVKNLISKELECPVPNPHLLSLRDDEIFTLDGRIKILEDMDVQQVKLHNHKALTDIQRANAARESPSTNNRILKKDTSTNTFYVSGTGGFPAYLWSDDQETARRLALNGAVPYVPGKLLRSSLRNVEERESHEIIKGWGALANVLHSEVLNLTGESQLKTFMQLDNIPPEMNRLNLGETISKFLNLEVLQLRGLSLKDEHFQSGWVLPKLLHLDISHNNLQSVLPLIFLATHSKHLQVLEMRQNPVTMSDTWPAEKSHPKVDVTGHCVREWRLLVEFPDLVILNGSRITLEHHEHVVIQFGDSVRQKRVGLRRWDQMICEAAPTLCGLNETEKNTHIWKPLAITHLKVPGVGLFEFHVGCFRSLLTLNLANNSIAQLCGAGLEACEFLWAINLSNNRIHSEKELVVFAKLPSLRCLFLDNNDLPENYRELVIHITRDLPGCDHTRGLLELDGLCITIDERVNASHHLALSELVVNSANGALRAGRKNTLKNPGSRVLCCFKSKSRSRNFAQDSLNDAGRGEGNSLDSEPSSFQLMSNTDVLRQQLELERSFGRGYLASISSMESIIYLRLAGRNIRRINLSSFRKLEVLELQANPLEHIIGLDKLSDLHVLDLRGHPKSGSEGRIQEWLKIAESKLLKLHSISLLSEPLTGETSVQTFQKQILSVLKLKTHKFLNMIEEHSISIRLRAEILATEMGISMGSSTLAEKIDSYKANLAILTCTKSAIGRSYDLEDVIGAAQYSSEKVVELERMHGLALNEKVLDFSKFCLLRVLNLSDNKIKDIRNLGLSHASCPSLRVLDISNNNIDMKLDDVGSFVNELKNLTVFCIRENPCMIEQDEKRKRRPSLLEKSNEVSSYSKTRMQLLGAIMGLREIDCKLRIIDTQITVDERIEAWKQSTSSEKSNSIDIENLEMMRTRMALFIAMPSGIATQNVTHLDLDGQLLRNVPLNTFESLKILRLRGNLLTSLDNIGGFDGLKKLRALDVRDNLLKLDKKTITQMARRLKHMECLVYLGLWTQMSSEESPQRRRQSMLVAAHARHRRSSMRASADMTDVIAIAIASSDEIGMKDGGSTDSGSNTISDSKSNNMLINQDLDENDSTDHSGAKVGSSYRKSVIRAMLPLLKRTTCRLRYLDWDEISIGEIFSISSVKGGVKTAIREQFRFDLISFRVIGSPISVSTVATKDTSGHNVKQKSKLKELKQSQSPSNASKAIRELDLSGYELKLVDLHFFRNLIRLSIANNNINDSCLQDSGIQILKQLYLLDISSNEIVSIKIMAKCLDHLPRLGSLFVSGNKAYDALTSLKSSDNQKKESEKRVHLLGSLSRTGWVDFPISLINGQSVEFRERIEGLRNSRRGDEAEMMLLARWLKKRQVNVWSTEMKICCELNGGLSALGLKAQAQPKFTELERKLYPPFEYSMVHLFRVRTFRHFPNGAFRNIHTLNLSGNRLTTLSGSYLHLIPRLSGLDLRQNRLESLDSLISEFQKCMRLQHLCLHMAGTDKKVWGNSNLYADIMFQHCCGLKYVDDRGRPQKYTLSVEQKSAADFLRVVARVPMNSIRDLDMSFRQLEQEHFGFILSALSVLQGIVVTIKMHDNPWENTGVGPSNDHYRKYIVAKMGDALLSVDGIEISEDERGIAAEWFEKQKKDFGKAAKNMDKKWGHVLEQATVVGEIFAKQRMKQEDGLRKTQQAGTSKSLPSDRSGMQNTPDSSSSAQATSLSSSLTGADSANEATDDGTTASISIDEGEDEDFAVDIDQIRDGPNSKYGSMNRDDGENEDNYDYEDDSDDDNGDRTHMQQDSSEVNQILATGEMATKFEVVVNFLQIYGLVLNFDISIQWPYAWSDFQKFFAWLPSILILDLQYLFRFQFGILVTDDQIAYITFFSVILFVIILLLLYRFFSNLRKENFLKSNVERWGRRVCTIFFIWVLLLIITLVLVLVVDSPVSMSKFLTWPWSDKMQSYLWPGVGISTLSMLIWFLAVRKLRNVYLSDETPAKSKFTVTWSSMKRTLQKICLFMLSVAYIPVSRTILSTMGSDYDPVRLNTTNCTHTLNNVSCCLRIFQGNATGGETCAIFQSEKALPLQITSLFFLAAIVIGLPIFFLVLVRKGVDEISRGGYLLKKTNMERSIRRHQDKMANIKLSQTKKMQDKIANGQDIDNAKIMRYAVMGRHDAQAEIRAVGKIIKEEEKKLKNLYSQEVLNNPKAQTYLYQPYDFKHRYYKVFTLFQKLVLLILQLFVPPAVAANLKLWLGTAMMTCGAFFASFSQPFSDSMESLMEASSQITNAINILVGLGIARDIPWLKSAVGDIILFAANGLNLSVFAGVLVVSPLRNCLFARRFAEMQAHLQAKKIEEFTKRQAFLAAQKANEGLGGALSSDVVRTAGRGLADGANAGAEGLENGIDGVKNSVQNLADGASKLSNDSMEIYNSEEAMAVRGSISDAMSALSESARTSVMEGASAAKAAVTEAANVVAKGTAEASTAASKVVVDAGTVATKTALEAASIAQKAAVQGMAATKNALEEAAEGVNNSVSKASIAVKEGVETLQSTGDAGITEVKSKFSSLSGNVTAAVGITGKLVNSDAGMEIRNASAKAVTSSGSALASSTSELAGSVTSGAGKFASNVGSFAKTAASKAHESMQSTSLGSGGSSGTGIFHSGAKLQTSISASKMKDLGDRVSGSSYVAGVGSKITASAASAADKTFSHVSDALGSVNGTLSSMSENASLQSSKLGSKLSGAVENITSSIESGVATAGSVKAPNIADGATGAMKQAAGMASGASASEITAGVGAVAAAAVTVGVIAGSSEEDDWSSDENDSMDEGGSGSAGSYYDNSD